MYLYPVVEIRVVILFQLVTIIMMVYLMEIRLIVIVSVLTHREKGWFSFGENLAYSLTNTDPNQTNTYNDFYV